MMKGEQLKKFQPWIYFDKKTFEIKIKEDAPKEIKEEYEKSVIERW